MPGTGLRAWVNYHGCEKRKLDAQLIVDYLIVNGYKIVPNPNTAVLCIYVTCAFCQTHEDLSLKKLAKFFQQKAPAARFIISGCLPAIHPEALDPFPGIIRIGPRELDQLDALINAKVPFNSIPDANRTRFEGYRRPPAHFLINTPENARNLYDQARIGFKIRINEGCLGNCAYCVTRLATGKLQSKPLDTVLVEVKKGIETGEKSIFFTGGDTGAYGKDLGIDIAVFMTAVLGMPGDFKVHFHDFGVNWLIIYAERLLPLLKAYRTKLGCFNLPVQSGSDRILRLMRRPYTAAAALEMMQRAKIIAPELQIGSHFIVGFPGETEADFLESIKFVEQAPIDFLMVFRYTDHIHADSHAFEGKIDEQEKKARYTRLYTAFEQKQRRKIV